MHAYFLYSRSYSGQDVVKKNQCFCLQPCVFWLLSLESFASICRENESFLDYSGKETVNIKIVGSYWND